MVISQDLFKIIVSCMHEMECDCTRMVQFGLIFLFVGCHDAMKLTPSSYLIVHVVFSGFSEVIDWGLGSAFLTKWLCCDTDTKIFFITLIWPNRHGVSIFYTIFHFWAEYEWSIYAQPSYQRPLEWWFMQHSEAQVTLQQMIRALWQFNLVYVIILTVNIFWSIYSPSIIFALINIKLVIIFIDIVTRLD